MVEKTIVLLKIPITDSDFKIGSSFIEDNLGRIGCVYTSLNVTLDEHDIQNIYAHAPPVILNSILARLAYKILRVYLISGDGVVDTICTCKGAKTEPLECAPSSWRFQLAQILYVRHIILLSHNECGVQSHVTVVDNFIHAPGRDDVECNLNVFKKYTDHI